MGTSHVKSPCCRVGVRRFGSRRRQCVICHRTWRIRKKRRGRKSRRPQSDIVRAYLGDRLGRFAYGDPQREQMQRRIRKGLTAYIAHLGDAFPKGEGPLIAVADGMWQMVAGQRCTVYLILLRPLHEHHAWILPPIVVPGKESGTGWGIAVEEIPPALRKRMVALVCDGEPSLIGIGRQEGWHIQRCWFHLFASIRNYVRTGPMSKQPLLGQTILETLRTALTVQDDYALTDALGTLSMLASIVKNPLLRTKLTGFVRHADDYRTYLIHPHLHLPTTSNSAESLIRCIRNLLSRARGFRTPASFTSWVRAYCHYKQTMMCNGKDQPN